MVNLRFVEERTVTCMTAGDGNKMKDGMDTRASMWENEDWEGDDSQRKKSREALIDLTSV